MRRDGFARQVRDGQRGRGDGPPHDVRCSEAGQTCLVRADEDGARLMERDASLIHQRLQCFYEITRDGHNPLLAAFAAQENL